MRGIKPHQACIAKGARLSARDNGKARCGVGINDERDIEANLQIGPTDQGRVRLFIAAGDFEIPMDFDADEAEEIAEEIRAAAAAARRVKPRRR
jgi:hypothetical protein